MINVHHLGEVIQEALGDGSKWEMALSYSVEKDLLGTGGGLKQVESFFEGQPFLVLNGDTVVNLNLSDMMLQFQESGALALMALRDDPDVSSWGVVETDGQNRILRINGRGGGPGNQQERVHQRMFAGIHIMDPLLLQNIPKGTSWSIIDEYVVSLEKGAYILGYPFSGYWSDVGTPERYAQIQKDVLAGLLPFP
jgi:NDP-sugar pyrophosphorylase family protein